MGRGPPKVNRLDGQNPASTRQHLDFHILCMQGNSRLCASQCNGQHGEPFCCVDSVFDMKLVLSAQKQKKYCDNQPDAFPLEGPRTQRRGLRSPMLHYLTLSCLVSADLIEFLGTWTLSSTARKLKPFQDPKPSGKASR